MNPCIEQLKAYIAANPPKYHFCNGESVLEMLYCTYMESNPVDCPRIRAGFQGLRRWIRELPEDAEDAVFDMVCDLCGEHEYRGFAEGIRAGGSLMMELREGETQGESHGNF